VQTRPSASVTNGGNPIAPMIRATSSREPTGRRLPGQEAKVTGDGLDADDPVVLFHHSREFRWREPARLDPLEILVGRPPGDGASLSDVDRHLVLAELSKEVAHGRNADTFDALGGLP
jgi:hypothetical protein